MCIKGVAVCLSVLRCYGKRCDVLRCFITEFHLTVLCIFLYVNALIVFCVSCVVV